MKYIIANWKMNMNLTETKKWLFDFKNIIEEKTFKNKIVLAPPSVYLEEVSNFCKINNLFCSSQDVSLYEKGAHTGEVGIFELKDYCSFSIVGHSERKEPREIVIKKTLICLEHKVTPFVCFINKLDFAAEASKEKIMCWEDPSNISKNGIYQKTSIEDIAKMMGDLKQIKKDTVILYGGSVNRDNKRGLKKIPDIDGG